MLCKASRRNLVSQQRRPSSRWLTCFSATTNLRPPVGSVPRDRIRGADARCSLACTSLLHGGIPFSGSGDPARSPRRPGGRSDPSNPQPRRLSWTVVQRSCRLCSPPGCRADAFAWSYGCNSVDTCSLFSYNEYGQRETHTMCLPLDYGGPARAYQGDLLVHLFSLPHHGANPQSSCHPVVGTQSVPNS